MRLFCIPKCTVLILIIFCTFTHKVTEEVRKGEGVIFLLSSNEDTSRRSRVMVNGNNRHYQGRVAFTQHDFDL